MKTKKMKWIAGYENYMDWILAPNTPDNRVDMDFIEWDEYATFAEAKKSIIDKILTRIEDEKHVLKYIRRITKANVEGRDE